MNRHTQCCLYVLIAGLLLMGCAETNMTPETITIRQQTPGQSERFTQFELDVAFRKQAREDARALRAGADTSICCALFYRDVKMLDKVIAHFNEHVSVDDIDDYGILVQENEDEYIVILWERYKETTQYQIDGFWYPGIGGEGEIRHREYGYLVDRNTLEIVDFAGRGFNHEAR